MSDTIKVSSINSKGYGIIPKLLMTDKNIHIYAKAIYAYFCSYAGNGNNCFPSREKIYYDLGISRDTFSKYLNQLVDNGYISVEQVREKGKFSNNIYTLLDTISPLPKRTDSDEMDSNNNSSFNNNSYFNNECKKEKKQTDSNSYEQLINEFTDDEVIKETIYDFIKMRKLIKAPVTDRALKSVLKQLNKLSKDKEKQIQILEQSIRNNWRDVLPLREERQSNKHGKSAFDEALDEIELELNGKNNNLF